MDQSTSEQNGRVSDQEGAGGSQVHGVESQADSDSAKAPSPEQSSVGPNWKKTTGVNREFIDSLKQLRDVLQSQVDAKRDEVERLRQQIRGISNE